MISSAESGLRVELVVDAGVPEEDRGRGQARVELAGVEQGPVLNLQVQVWFVGVA